MRLESAVRFHRLPRRLIQQGLIRRLHRVNDPAGEQVVVQGARDRRGQGDVSLLPSLRAMPFDLNRQVVSAGLRLYEVADIGLAQFADAQHGI
jgi:hypothetical protein